MPQPKKPTTALLLKSRGYTVLDDRSDRRAVLDLIHQELVTNAEQHATEHLSKSLHSLARLNRRRNPQHAERYEGDAQYVAQGLVAHPSERPGGINFHEQSLPVRPKRARVPRRRVAAARVSYVDDDNDNSPWDRAPGHHPVGSASVDDLNASRRRLAAADLDHKYDSEDMDDANDDGEAGFSEPDVHFRPAGPSKRRRDDDDDVPTMSNKRPRTINRKRKTPDGMLDEEEKQPGLVLMNRPDQYLDEERQYANRVGSVANGRARRRQRVEGEYADAHNGQRIDGGTLYIADLRKRHVNAWHQGRAVRFDGGDLSMVPTTSHKNAIVFPEEEFKRGLWASKSAGRRVQLKMTKRHFHHNALIGGGFGDFVDWLGDTAKKALDIGVKYIGPIVGQVLDALPITDPRFLFIKGLLKTVQTLGEQVNGIVNKRAEQAADVDDKAADLYDAQAASREPGLSTSQKTALAIKAKTAKERLAQSKARLSQLKKDEAKAKKTQASETKKLDTAAAKVQRTL